MMILLCDMLEFLKKATDSRAIITINDRPFTMQVVPKS